MPDQILKDINDAILAVWGAAEYDRDAIPNHIIMPYEQFNYLATTRVSELAEKTILQFLLDNNVAKTNGSDLYIGGCSWCKGAGTGGKDRMVVYLNKERFVATDELAPLSRVMTLHTWQIYPRCRCIMRTSCVMWMGFKEEVYVYQQ